MTKVYLNGQPASYGNSTDPQTPSGHLRIGAHIGGRFFNGVIDEVKIFGKALDDNQVFMEYETTKAPLTVASGIGSGKALSFDGIDDCVDLHTQLIPTSGNFTVDLWLKNRSVSGFREFVSQGPDGNAFFIGTSDNSNLLRAGSNWLETGVELPLNDWAHVAIVKSGSTGLLYLDGVLRATKENYYIGDGGSATAFARQFGYYGEYPDADLDEARFWNTALTQSQIRDRMARKITPSDPLFDHLLAYYNFDQEDALVVTDVKSGHNGTLVNHPSWVTSGAPIGDASAHTYGGNSVSIAHDQGESLTVSDFSAIPTGVHVYVVNSAPNSTSGIAGPGQNDRYFGVHYFGQSGVSYTVSYYYAGNPYVNSSNEAGLTIFKRDNNADPTWQAAGLALSNENQTISVISMDSEYMLGSESGALPVTLLSFIARKHESSVDLSWQTTEETNSDHFEVLHSPDGKTWAAVGSLNAARESNSVISYRYLHSSPVNGINYYRLKTVDRDGSIAYSGIASVALETVFSQVVYPNPVDGSYMTVSYHGRRPEISLTDMTGRRIGVGILEERPGVLRLEPEHRLPSGVYILRATDGKAQVVHKVIVAE